MLLLPIVALMLYALFTVLSRFPHRLNYPWAITEQNARSQYTHAQELLAAVKVSVVCMMAYISWG